MTATRGSRRTSFRPAAEAGPCASCPWMLANAGKPTAHGWYTKTNLRRLWSGLRRGERMTCHGTDPDNEPLPGKAAPKDGHPTAECTGALVLIQRELQRVNDDIEAGGNLTAYRRENPNGLTREGMAVHAMNVQWGGAMPGTLQMAKPNLNDTRVGYAELTPWVAK